MSGASGTTHSNSQYYYPPPAEVAALRARIWDAEFRPVPVYTVEAGKRLGHAKPGKHPFGAKWQMLARQNPPAAVSTTPHPDALNTGILADGLRVVDLDIDNPTLAHSCVTLAYEMFGEAPTRWRSNSSRRLVVYRAADGEPVKQTITGTLGKIEVLGKGQQFVAFGDHESGAVLQWVGDAPGDVLASSIPVITEQQVHGYLARCAAIIGAKPWKPAGDERTTNQEPQADPLLLASALAFVPNDEPTDWDYWKRICMALWAATGGSEAGWNLFSAWSERNPAYDPGETRKQWDVLRTSPPTGIGAGTIFHIAAEHGWKRPTPPKAKKQCNALALVTVIDTHQAWQNSVRLNRFTETIEVSDAFPIGGGGYRPIREPGDVLNAMLWFQGHGFPKAGKNMVLDALCAVAERHAYHPVQRYLDGLKWDGTARLSRLFQHYLAGAIPDSDDDQEQDRVVAYLEHISTCWPISAVARIYRPGCKVDHVPILLSPQNFNKSKAVRALCPDPAWFAEDLSTELGQRDTKESLNGKWLLELSEFPHARKEIDRVKAFFSKQTDRYRRAYDRLTQDWPRQCCFIGTTNDLEFIDPTGSRRFWPVEVTEPIDVASIEADRDQLWAEAVHLFRQGYAWWLPATIEIIANQQQEQFDEEDIWTGIIAGHIETQGLISFTLADIMTSALRFPAAVEIKKAEQMRAGQCLKSLGYRRKLKRVPGKKKREWIWRLVEA